MAGQSTMTDAGLHPASAVQRRMRFAELLEPDSTAYLLSTAFELAGPLDVTVLHAALNDLVARHESLRTEIHDDGGDIGLRVRDHVVVDLRVVDLPAPTVARPDHAVAELCARDAARRLDLRVAPLLRATVLVVDPRHHVLSLVTHHIACDGWSAEILAGDLAELYAARAARRPAELPGVTGRYVEFVESEQRWRDGGARAKQLAYWRDRLDGIAPVVLPAPAAGTGVDLAGAEEHEFPIPAAAVSALAAVGREVGVSVFMTYLTLFGIVLSAYQPGADLAIGTPVANRHLRAFEGTVGCFVNTVAVRVPASTGATLRSLLVEVRESVLEAFENGDVPFDEVVDELRPDRAAGAHPLFRVEFSVPPTDTVVPRFGEVDVRRLPGTAPMAKFDLALSVERRADRVVGVLRYRRAALDRSGAARLAELLVRTAEYAGRAPDAVLDDLEPTSPDERELLLRSWNGRADAAAGAPSVPQLVLAQAQRRPTGIALESGARTVTYAELVEAARALAETLVARGAGPERVVAVCLPHGPELVIALLAVLLSGAAYQPLDPAHPAQRVAALLADTGAVLGVADAATAGVLPAQLPWVDVAARRPAAVDSRLPDGDPDPSSAAYVIHTSGTTGRPKGVLVEHRSLGAYVARCVTAYPALARGAVLHTPVAFDLAVTALWGTLAAGGRLTLVELSRIVEVGVPAPPLFKVTPSQLDVLDETVLPTDTLMCGGEQLPGSAVAAWRRRHPDGLVVNHYGPTETTVGCTDHHVQPASPVRDADVPIGRPFGYARAYVLDPLLRLCPVGVPGELHVGGLGVARGYVGQPAATALRFVADPFGPPGGRMYRTGDIVRWDPDGHLVHLGRADDQVKIRGVRVEPAEIRSALLDVAEVGSAAVVATGSGAGRRIVAYVTPADGARRPGLADTVRTQVARRLPAALRPAQLVVLDRLPLTAHGKLDRSALPAADDAPAADASAADRTADRPAGPSTMSTRALTLVAELLGSEPVSPEADFFDLGGNSLLAMRLVGQVRARLGRELTVAAVFDAATLGELAAIVETAPPSSEAGPGGERR